MFGIPPNGYLGHPGIEPATSGAERNHRATDKHSWEFRENVQAYQQNQHITRGMDWISKCERC